MVVKCNPVYIGDVLSGVLTTKGFYLLICAPLQTQPLIAAAFEDGAIWNFKIPFRMSLQKPSYAYIGSKGFSPTNMAAVQSAIFAVPWMSWRSYKGDAANRERPSWMQIHHEWAFTNKAEDIYLSVALAD